MRERSTRALGVARRTRRIDRLMLPAVTVLLVAGAVFVTLAWSTASDAVERSERKDAVRVDRLAAAVAVVLERSWSDLDRWARDNEATLQGGEVARGALDAALARQVQGTAAASMVAWVVVDARGRVVAIGERRAGTLERAGLLDDLGTFGRSVIVRDEPRVSGRLKLSGRSAVALSVPVEHGSGGRPAALMMVNDIGDSAVGAFLEQDGRSRVDAAVLVDVHGRTVLGTQSAIRGDRIRRDVGRSGWAVELARERTDTLLPSWAYPGFALLLVIVAAAYLAQEVTRRRLRRVGDARARQVHGLYDLAERMLHGATVEEQAQELASAALQLAGAGVARVRVHASTGVVERSAGHEPDGVAHSLTVAVQGPSEVLGELEVLRSGQAFDEEADRVLRTAGSLAGAAIHTLRALETERAAAAELQRLDELRSNLLATVAHELLSPVTAVKGVLDLLTLQEDLGGRGREYVGVAIERTDRLVALIRDLFDCSLLETGQLDIRPRRQHARSLLEAALGAQAAASGGDLRLVAPDDMDITVDPVRFDQLVNNLVTNALRHGRAPVEVTLERVGSAVAVIVSDEGPGIAPVDRDEVFQKFWQGSSGTARAVEGAGLGLSLVQGLVQLHGGTIEIGSVHADGRGARVVATFPDDVAS